MDQSFYHSHRPFREIRAVYTDATIRVYQAFGNAIALPALKQQKLVDPFNFDSNITWVKPSFLWAMKRTHWGRYSRISKVGLKGENEDDATVLGISVSREFFDSVLCNPYVNNREDEPGLTPGSRASMRSKAGVIVQWDPDKDTEGHRRPYKAIQIGLLRQSLRLYNEANVCIEDMTDTIVSIKNARNIEEQIELLPNERVYPIPEELAEKLHMTDKWCRPEIRGHWSEPSG